MYSALIAMHCLHVYPPLEPPAPAGTFTSGGAVEPRSRRCAAVTNGGVSDRVFAALAGADTHRFFDLDHEDLAVTDAAGLRRLLDRLDDLAHLSVRDHQLDLNFGYEI